MERLLGRHDAGELVDGVFQGPAEEGEKLIEPFRGIGEPIADTWAAMPLEGLPKIHMDPPEPSPGVGEGGLTGRLDEDGIEKLIAVAGPGSGSPLTALELRQLGGALARAPESAGALDRLDADLTWYAVGAAPVPEAQEAIRSHLPKVLESVSGNPSGRSAYLNFTEGGNRMSDAFDDATLQRLARVKAEVDPDGLIRAAQYP